MTVRDVDVIVIGAGQGGVPLAATLAQRGRAVVLIERGAVGGTCVNSGCTPSKSFLAPAHAAARARRAENIGVRGSVSVDFAASMQRVRSIVTDFRDESERRLASAGVRLVRATARFTGERVVDADGEQFRAPLVIIDTGASATIPRIGGLEGTPYLDNVTFFAQTQLPRRLIVVGGGYVGLELGQGMARCGSEVHIFHPQDRVLDTEEPESSAVLEASLREDGITLHLRSRVESATHDGTMFTIACSNGETLSSDALLVATGRTPNTAALDLPAGGIDVGPHGTVAVDDYLRTSCEGVYALGEVAGQPAFTHVAWEDHRRILSTLDGKPRRRDDLPLVYSTFTDPQVAHAGLTRDGARAAGIDALAVTIPITDVARGIEMGERYGFFRMVIDNATDRIIGATLVGYETAELIHVFVAHLMAGSTWQRLGDSMHVHPTFAEGLPTLARSIPDARSAMKAGTA